MRKFIAIGEALIDMIPCEKGVALKKVSSFERMCGGAPTNVACAYAMTGGDARVLTMLGKDAFGDFLVDTMEERGINTSLVLRTDKANTALAFVSLDKNGNRDFSFYRKPSADMLLDKNDLKEEWFDKNILHFCSVDLVECPMKGAHKRAIEITEKKGGVVSFDPNLRFPLWDDHEELKKTVLEFCRFADIIKVSDEEIEFLAGTSDPDKAAAFFLALGAKVVFVTLGKAGANMYTSDKKSSFGGYPTTAIDTTGAGDIFIGTALSAMEKLGCDLSPTEDQMEKILKIACYASSLSVRCKGATYDLDALYKKFPEMR